MRLKLICAVLVAFVLVIAPGCGSKKKAASTTTATTASALSSTDCTNLKAAASIITNAQSGKLPANMGEQVAALQVLAKKAPASVQADIATLQAVATPLLKALKLKPGQTSLTPAQQTKLMQAMAKMNITKLTAALADLGAWGKKMCTAK
ncbi:MAG: hypothetical protein ABSB96_03455 [Gaiellaceae bacterium]